MIQENVLVVCPIATDIQTLRQYVVCVIRQ